MLIRRNKREQETGVWISFQRHVNAGSVSQIRPEFFRRCFGDSSSDRFSLCEACGPIHLARLIRRERRKFSEALPIFSNRDLFPMIDPFSEPGEVVAQLADSRGFHL